MNATTSLGVFLIVLPGSDRKRTPNPYQYRVTYRSPEPEETGCVMTWAVEGGREVYQVALERTKAETLRWHCTCADNVYRGEKIPGHVCKHVHHLKQCFPAGAF